MLRGARRNFVFDTIGEISQPDAVSDISIRLTIAMAHFGFTSLGINGLPFRKLGADPVILTESAPSGFRELYIRETLYLSDHICVHGRTAHRPFRYSDAPYDAVSSRAHRRFLEVLQTFHMGRGLMVPVGRPSYLPACVWLAGENPDLDDDTILATQLITLFAASEAYALPAEADQNVSPLSIRERDVLAWSAVGKSAWEIGRILSISKRTVDEHASVAARKLGAAGRTHAVAIAISRGIIEV